MHWPPTRGDAKAQLERFTFGTGIAASNSFRGMFYGKITATAVELYDTQARASGDLVASGNHSQSLAATNTSFLVVTLTAQNSSGLADITCYLAGKEASATWEVWPSFATDTELAVSRIDVTRFPKSSGTTFWDQHKRVTEEFVRLMRQRIPPAYQVGRTSARIPGQVYNLPWRKNSVGDIELIGLQNLDDYRTWAEHYTMGLIFSTVNQLVPDTETQLRVIEESRKLASEAWAETIPQLDLDQDLDADTEHRRFRISRG